MLTYNKIRAYKELILRLKSRRKNINLDGVLINLTKDELDDIIEAMVDYTQTLSDTYGDELYHEQVDRIGYGF